jgi:hypothetical protein
MFRLPFFSLLFLALLNLVAASSVTYWISSQGFWFYHGEVEASNVDEFKNAVRTAYNDMATDVAAYNKANNKAAKTPSMMTGIFDGSSVILGSSVQGYTGSVQDVPADFPQALKDIMANVTPDLCHRHEGLCAEPMALAMYVLKKGTLPDTTKSVVATWGMPPGEKAPGAHNPCSTDAKGYGCKDLLQKLGLNYFPKLVAKTSSTASSQPTPTAGKVASTSSKTPSQPKPPAGNHRRAIADEIHSLLLMVRDLQAFDDFLAKREFLMTEEYF